MGTMMDCGPAARDLLGRLTTPTRNRYYYGKLLDAFHLELEQDYGNRKRWLLNRLSLGTGVLCGLRVEATADGTQVRVGPGVAIDGWGREILVEKPSPGVDPRQPTDDCGSPVGAPVRERGRTTLWICYHECEVEPSPVIVSDCDRSCEYGLIRERYRLRISRGVPNPPGIVTPEQCKAIFSAAPDEAARRRTATQVLAGLCLESDESCVPLAVLELNADGRVAAIDPITIRPMLYSNAVLLDLILCLAERVDECCPPQAVLSLQIVSGDSQVADAGARVADPLVVRVTQGGNPVQGEQVTFRIDSGGGRIGNGGLGNDFQTPTLPDGTAALPVWELGAIPGSQRVTAEIAAGAPSLVTFRAMARRVEVDLPVVNNVWPLPGTTLRRTHGDEGRWWELFFRLPRLELVFNRPMREGHLERPDEWLRLYLAAGIRNDYRVRKLGLRRATPAEAAGIPPVLPFTPGTREIYLIAPPDRDPGPLEETAKAMRAFLEAMLGELPELRFFTLMNADPALPRIVDQSAQPLVLDADYAATSMRTDPGLAAGTTLWNDLWNAGNAPPVFGASLWNKCTLPIADTLPSGDATEGGRFDSWFAITRD